MTLQRALLLIIGTAGFGSQVYAQLTGIEVNLPILGISLILLLGAGPQDVLKAIGKWTEPKATDEKRTDNQSRSDGPLFRSALLSAR